MTTKKNTSKAWQRIADDDVAHAWQCPRCKDVTWVSPDYYTENGTPVCAECDEDMAYLRTEVKQPSGDGPPCGPYPARRCSNSESGGMI